MEGQNDIVEKFNRDASMMFICLFDLCASTAGSDHLRDVFVEHMGLSDKDIVALSGAHTLVCVIICFPFLPCLSFVLITCAVRFFNSMHKGD